MGTGDESTPDGPTPKVQFRPQGPQAPFAMLQQVANRPQHPHETHRAAAPGPVGVPRGFLPTWPGGTRRDTPMAAKLELRCAHCNSMQIHAYSFGVLTGIQLQLRSRSRGLDAVVGARLRVVCTSGLLLLWLTAPPMLSATGMCLMCYNELLCACMSMCCC